jgi:AraC-like DNA-binding protein
MAERLFLRLEGDPLYAPETTIPAGALREFPVPPALQDCVAQVIAYDEVLPLEVTERVLPDGALRLIFDFRDAQHPARVAGPSTSPVLLRLRGHLHGLSVTLRPGAAQALFGTSAHELAQRVVPWDVLANAGQRSLIARLHEAPDDSARVDILVRALQGMLHDADIEQRHTAGRAAALFRHSHNRRSVRAVAQALGLGERRLQQIFRAQVGLSPRAFGRLARMHECLRLLRPPASRAWTELAAQAGFYDQSHLINEFKAHCGLTPEQYVRRFVSASSKTAR